MSTPIDHADVLRWLQARGEQLRMEIAAAQQPPERNHEVGDFKDEATDSAIAVVSNAEGERDRAELLEIEHAQSQVRRGRYGICDDCGVPIDKARLRARPASSRCLGCQQAAERSNPQVQA